MTLSFSCADVNDSDVLSDDPVQIKVLQPTNKDLKRLSKKISRKLNSDVIELKATKEIRIKEDQELCDGIDNDSDGLIDEGCFKCLKEQKFSDLNADGKVDKYDCTFPILWAYGKTTVKNSPDCADLDKDGSIGLSDTIKCLEKIHKGNP